MTSSLLFSYDGIALPHRWLPPLKLDDKRLYKTKYMHTQDIPEGHGGVLDCFDTLGCKKSGE